MAADDEIINKELVNDPFSTLIVIAGRPPGGSVGNLETFWRWDVSSHLGVVTRTGIFPHKKKKKEEEKRRRKKKKKKEEEKCPTSSGERERLNR